MIFTAVDGQCIFHLVVTVIILEVSRPGRYKAVAELAVANVDLYKWAGTTIVRMQGLVNIYCKIQKHDRVALNDISSERV